MERTIFLEKAAVHKAEFATDLLLLAIPVRVAFSVVRSRHPICLCRAYAPDNVPRRRPR